MKLVFVEASFSEDDLDQATQALLEQVEMVQSMAGCAAFAFYRRGTSIAIIQRWRTAAHFDAYRQSDVFAKLGAALKPLMVSLPMTTIASVVDG